MGWGRSWNSAVVLLLGWAFLHAKIAKADDPATGLQTGVVFQDYGPLARSSEIIRRAFTPLTAAAITREIAGSGKTLSETSLDLSNEKFLV